MDNLVWLQTGKILHKDQQRLLHPPQFLLCYTQFAKLLQLQSPDLHLSNTRQTSLLPHIQKYYFKYLFQNVRVEAYTLETPIILKRLWKKNPLKKNCSSHLFLIYFELHLPRVCIINLISNTLAYWILLTEKSLRNLGVLCTNRWGVLLFFKKCLKVTMNLTEASRHLFFL